MGAGGGGGRMRLTVLTSMKIAQPMLTKINLAHPDVVTSSCGICQSQIRQGVKTSEDGKDGVQVVHPLRLLYEALRP